MTDQVAAPAEGQAAPESWAAALPDELRGYVETKGFKEPAAIVESYRNLEKLRGVPESRLLKLPEKMDDAEALGPVYDRLGRPASADKYTKAIESMDDTVFKGIATEAHKLGLNDAQFAGLQKITGGLAQQLAETQEAEAAKAFDAWKGQNPEGFNNAARVVAGLGIKEDQLAGILAGDKVAMYDFLAKVAARSQEGQVIQGEQPGNSFNLSPDGAKAKIAELLGDKDFMAQYTNRSAAIRQPAIDRMSKLQEAASRGARQ